MARQKCAKYVETSNIDSSDDDAGDAPGHRLRKRTKMTGGDEQPEFSLGLLQDEAQNQGSQEANGGVIHTEQAPFTSTANSRPVASLIAPPLVTNVVCTPTTTSSVPPSIPVIELEFQPAVQPVENISTPRRPFSTVDDSVGAVSSRFTSA